MKLDFYHNKIVAESLTLGFEEGFKRELLPLLENKYGVILEVQMYEDYIADKFDSDGYWYYPLTVLTKDGALTQWVSWQISDTRFHDGNPYAFIGEGDIGFKLCDSVPSDFEGRLVGRSRYYSGGGVGVDLKVIGGDVAVLSGKYSQTFIDEMSRQLTSAIQSACGVEGLADSTVQLVMAFAPNTYMEHTSENRTYRRLMLIDKVSAPRDFWIQWTRLDGAVAHSVSSHVSADNILFELGEDVDQKIREKEYRYLLSSGKEKYHNAMGRRKVTEWREIIKRAAVRGDLSKIDQDAELSAETLELEERIAILLGKKPVSKAEPVKEEIPFVHADEDEFERAMQKARMLVEAVAEEPTVTDDMLEFEAVADDETEEDATASPLFEALSEIEDSLTTENSESEVDDDTNLMELDEADVDSEDSTDSSYGDEESEELMLEDDTDEDEDDVPWDDDEIFSDSDSENEDDCEEPSCDSDEPIDDEFEDDIDGELDEEELDRLTALALEALSTMKSAEREDDVEEDDDIVLIDGDIAYEPEITENELEESFVNEVQLHEPIEIYETKPDEEVIIDAPVFEAEQEITEPDETEIPEISLVDRVADIRAELEAKIRLEYEIRARIKAEAEVTALKRELEKLKLDSESALSRASKEIERLRIEYEALVLQTKRVEQERAAREAQRRREEEKLREQIELQLREEASERERLAEEARVAIEEQRRLEAENARMALLRAEEERIEADRRKREEEQKRFEALRQAELDRIRREEEEAKERARNAMPDMSDSRYTYTSKSVRFVFRKSVDPNITTRIQEIIKATVDYYGKDRVYLKIKATIPDTQTVVLDFEHIPIEEMELLGNIIKILGNSGLGIAKAIIE